MYVSDLVKELQTYPQDVWVDVMFNDDSSLFQIEGLDIYTLSQGNERVVISISEDVPLRTA